MSQINDHPHSPSGCATELGLQARLFFANGGIAHAIRRFAYPEVR
jgi:hypothetical protein